MKHGVFDVFSLSRSTFSPCPWLRANLPADWSVISFGVGIDNDGEERVEYVCCT
jgi:hypothetical protein